MFIEPGIVLADFSCSSNHFCATRLSPLSDQRTEVEMADAGERTYSNAV